jgi:N-acetylmuramic acid 6-phosphate (MurNAc-6-P) etherase
MPEVIDKAIADAGGNAKLAIVIISRGVDAKTAQELLNASGGFLRKALGA